MSEPKKPPTTGNIFANALASRQDWGGKAVTAGVHNTLMCGTCGAARERDAQGPLVCRYCRGALVAQSQKKGGT